MRWPIFLVLPIFLAISLSLHAGTVNWQGDLTSDWSTAGNWDTNLVPGNTDDVVITNTGFAPQINGGTFSAATLSLTGTTLTLKTGTQLNISTSAAINAGATLATEGSGRLILAGSATLTSVGNINGGVQMAASSVASFNGNGTQTGDVRLEPTASGAIINGSGSPAIAAAGSLTLEPIGVSPNQTTLNGSLTCAGTFNLNGNPSFDTQLNIANLVTLTINGTMNINAGSNGEGQVLGLGTLTITGGATPATLNINGANEDVPISCGALNTAGNFNVVTGTAILSTNATHSGQLSVAAGAILKLSGTTTLTSTGNIVGRLRPAGGAIIAFNGNGKQTGAVRIEPTGNNSIIQGSGNPAIASGATLTLEPVASSPATTQLNGPFICDGIFNLNGNASVDTVINITSGQLSINGTMNINAASNGEGQILGVGSLEINLGATLNINGANEVVPISCAALNNAGVINVASGATFFSTVATNSGLISVAPASALKMSGSASLASTGNISGRLQPTTNSVISFNGNATQVSNVRIEPLGADSIIQGNSPAVAIASGAALTLEPPGGALIPTKLASSLICNGTFNLNGNPGVDTQLNILVGSTLTINGTMNMNAASNGEGQVIGAGTLVISGGATPATLNMNGANEVMPITCNVLNNAGQIKVLSGNAILSTAATHSGTISIASGSVLQLSGSTTLTSTGDISGRLQPTTGTVISFNGNNKQVSNVRIEPLGGDSFIQGSGNPAISASATLTIEPAVGPSIQTKLIGPFVCDGTFNLNGNPSVDTLLNITASQLIINGTMNINAGSNGEGQILGVGTLAISSGATLNINGVNEIVPIACNVLNNAGQIKVLSGNAILSTAATHSGTMSIAPSSVLKLSATATLTSTGDISGRLQPTTGSVIAFNGNNKQVSNVRIEPLGGDSFIQGSGIPAISSGATLTIEPPGGAMIQTKLIGPFVCDGTFNLNGNPSVDTLLNITTNQLTINGTMNINAASNGEGQVLGAGSLAVSAGAILNINGANEDVPLACAALNNAGQINVLSGNASLSTIVTHSGMLSIGAGSVVKLSGSAALNSTGDIAGRLRPTTNSVIAFNGNASQVSAVRIEPLAGDSVIQGNAGIAIANSATLTIEPAAGPIIPIKISGPFICDGTFNLIGNPSVDTQLNITSGQLTINGTMNIGAGSNGEGQVFGAGTLSIAGGATLNINGANEFVPITCAALSNAGQIKVLSGNAFLSTLTANSGVLSIVPASMIRLSPTMTLTSTGDISGRLQPDNGTVIDFAGNGTQVSAVRIEPIAGGSNLNGTGTPAIAATGSLTLEPPGGSIIATNLAGPLICEGTFNLNGNPSVDTQLNILAGQTLTVNGTLNINAASNGEGQILGAGNLVVGTGGTLNANGANEVIPIQCGSFNNAGTLSANSGAVDILSGFTQSAGRSILNGGIIRIGGGAGTANYSGGTLEGSGTFQGNMSNTGATMQPNSASTLAISGTYTQAAGHTLLNGGTISIGGGSGTATYSGGTLEGNGNFQGNVNNTGATVKPGVAAGTLTLSGTYTQGAGGTLEIEIGGATVGSGYDQLIVTGAASLTGTLKAKLINGFVPAANVLFLQVLSAGSRSGTFSTIDTVDTATLRYFVVSYTATAVNLNTRTIPTISGSAIALNQDTPASGTITLSDPDGDVNTVSVVTNGALGTVTITNTATGAFTYVPAAGKFGFDQFVLKSNDGNVDSAPLTITVKILPTLKPVLTIDASQNPLRQNVPMTLTAVGSDPNGLTFTYLWDFADGSAADTANPVNHTFTSGGVYNVLVTADNGLEVFSATLQVTVFSPNSGADGVVNIDTGAPPVVNPIDAVSIAVIASDGGVIELEIAVDVPNRASAYNISTDFDGIQGRAATRNGSHPVHKFTEAGTYVATATVTDKGTGSFHGKVRKTLVIGQRETGETTPFTDLPAKPQPELGTIKGKFLFNGTKPDAVTFNSTIELPAGLDISKQQSLFVSLGNVFDSFQLQSRGKAILPTAMKRVTKASIKLPRLKKGQTLTTKGMTAKVQFTISGINLSNAGFDTEGIVAKVRNDEAGMKSVPRKIQLGLVFAGAPYDGQFDVDFTLGKNSDSGLINGRKSR